VPQATITRTLQRKDGCPSCLNVDKTQPAKRTRSCGEPTREDSLQEPSVQIINSNAPFAGKMFNLQSKRPPVCSFYVPGHRPTNIVMDASHFLPAPTRRVTPSFVSFSLGCDTFFRGLLQDFAHECSHHPSSARMFYTPRKMRLGRRHSQTPPCHLQHKSRTDSAHLERVKRLLQEQRGLLTHSHRASTIVGVMSERQGCANWSLRDCFTRWSRSMPAQVLQEQPWVKILTAFQVPCTTQTPGCWLNTRCDRDGSGGLIAGTRITQVSFHVSTLELTI
jgi:hypothetical protein